MREAGALVFPYNNKMAHALHGMGNFVVRRSRSGRPPGNNVAEAIRSVLKEKNFISCNVLCRHFRIAKASWLRVLRDSLDMKKVNLCWIPLARNKDQKVE
jgi:hypothetical protein